MTFRDYLRIFREQWLLIVFFALFGVGAAIVVYLVRPPEYTARLTMYVSSQGADSPQAAFQGAQLSQDRVASYTELLTSPRVTTDVIRRLGLADTPDQLARKMTATSKIDSVLLDVTVTDQSAQHATDIVNTVGAVFPDLVAELERPTTVGADPAVAVRVVQPAQVPLQPSSLGIAVTIALGLLGGLVIGIGTALARKALDTTVTSPQQLRDLTAAPNLGSIAYDPNVPKRPLTVHEDSQSPRSEAFRQLRTNLQFVDVDHPHKVIVVTSALPGEGKTTTIANMAIALSLAGNRILVVEADLRRPKLSDVLGVDRSVGLTNVLSGRAYAAQVIQQWGEGAFDVLSSGPLPPNPSELLASRRAAQLFGELREQYDFVLVDSPPVLPVTDAAVIAPAADGVIVICRFKKTTRSQVMAATELIGSVSSRILGTVFTMVPGSGPRAYAQYHSYYRREVPPLRPAAANTNGNGLGHPLLPETTAFRPAMPAKHAGRH